MDFSHILLFGGLTLFVGGVMCIGAAALNVEAFFEHPAAAQFVRSMGRNGARIFYVVFGAVVALVGGLMAARGLQIVLG
ncbi:MAG TPA: Imm17 family immunity protein [Pirellulaceae bacterium]|nr:Imm17 family immunity protein [Pirellulaceae bacterium]